MIKKIKVEKEVNITTLEVDAGVRYWEDGYVNGLEDKDGTLIPFNVNGRWKPVIDIDSGIVINWPREVEVKANVHYKVCDDGIYTLKDEEGNVVTKYDGYVPSCLQINDNGYGDYIIMEISESGHIKDWDPYISDMITNN